MLYEKLSGELKYLPWDREGLEKIGRCAQTLSMALFGMIPEARVKTTYILL